MRHRISKSRYFRYFAVFVTFITFLIYRFLWIHPYRIIFSKCSNVQLSILIHELCDKKAFLQLQIFKPDVINFLNFTTTKNITLFLIEERLLCCMLKHEEIWQVNSEIIFTSINDEDKVTKFGANLDQLSIIATLCEEVNMYGWTCKYAGDSISYIYLSRHFFFEKNEESIHIVIFEPKGNYFYIAKLPDNLTHLVDYSFRDGNYIHVFEPFNLSTIYLSEIFVNIPKDILSFLSSFSASRLIECNSTINQLYLNEPEAKILLNMTDSNKAMLVLKRFKELMDKGDIPFWLISDTLEGWYRYCKILSTNGQFNVGTWSRLKNKITQHLSKNNLIRRIEGYRGTGISYEIEGYYKIKLSLLTKAKEYYYSEFIQLQNAYMQYVYPSFNLCSTILFNMRINVPCDIKEFLRGEGYIITMHK